MAKHYLIKNIEGKLFYDDALVLNKQNAFKQIDHKVRINILNLLNKKPMYPIEIAKKLKLHEQKVYYHINQLIKADVLEITEKKEIRGTIAKKFAPKSMNFVLSLKFNGKNINALNKESKQNKLDQFLEPFIINEILNTKIIVGSPDPHGPFKARARDGHYAIELALFLGRLCSISKGYSTMLDVDLDIKQLNQNLVIVGGPVTNLAMAKINDLLPAKFSDKKPWGIAAKNNYSDDNIGIIVKIPNPYFKDKSILIIAGITYNGTRAAVLGLSKYSKEILSRYTGQKEYYCIVEGIDLDGDGKIDSIEVVE
jgi:hypothetical protein